MIEICITNFSLDVCICKHRSVLVNTIVELGHFALAIRHIYIYQRHDFKDSQVGCLGLQLLPYVMAVDS